MTQVLGVEAMRMPTLQLHGRNGQVLRLAPHALWIIDTNGRVDLTAWNSAVTNMTVTFGGLTNGMSHAFEVRATSRGSDGAAARVQAMPADDGAGTNSDLRRGEQFDPEYRKIHSGAVVPALIHDGQTILESSVIQYYPEDAFPEPSLMPEVRSRATGCGSC